MTLDEAIEGSQEAVTFLSIHNQPRLASAVKLGSEGLKGIKKVRKTLEPFVTALLPGETQE